MNSDHLTDEQIIQLLDGTADAELRRSIEEEPALAEQVAAYQQLQARLEDAGQDLPLVSDEVLADYLNGLLSDEASEALEMLIASSPTLTYRLEQLETDDTTLPEPATADDKIIAFPTATLGRVVNRGRGRTQTLPLDETNANFLFMQLGVSNMGDFQITGKLILGTDEASWQNTLMVIKQGEYVRSCIVQPRKNFTLELFDTSPIAVILTPPEGATKIFEEVNFNE
jgi:hypothetical protein